MSNDTTVDRRERPPSGRFVVRIDPDVHASLRERAHAAGISLNHYCGRKLRMPSSELHPSAVDVVGRAVSIVGDSLLGVVAFGSWARGEPGGQSDLDIMVVADAEVRIARDLYRQWDDRPRLEWDGHSVEPHFVHLAAEDAAPSGLWAEVAMDGIVLFERRLTVSLRIARLRRQILAGRISRRVVHGNPYWVRER